MVRRGSTVRVRQRALQKSRKSPPFLSRELARAPVCSGYGAVHGAFRSPNAFLSGPQSRFGTITVAVGLLSLRLKYQIFVFQTRGRPASAGVNFRDVVTGSLGSVNEGVGDAQSAANRKNESERTVDATRADKRGHSARAACARRGWGAAGKRETASGVDRIRE